jgi:hypothetical protein
MMMMMMMAATITTSTTTTTTTTTTNQPTNQHTAVVSHCLSTYNLIITYHSWYKITRGKKHEQQ